MTASTWTALPTWRGKGRTYEDNGTCPRCGCEADYDGPDFISLSSERHYDASCPRCGLEWLVWEYPDPVLEGLSDEELESRYATNVREIIL